MRGPDRLLDARVVEGDVEPAEALEDGLERCGDVVFDGDVAATSQPTASARPPVSSISRAVSRFP